MNSLSQWVYRTATTRGTKRTLISVAGAVFWYGVVAAAIVLAPLIDRWWGLHLSVPAIPRSVLSIFFLLVGVLLVGWTILRFFQAKGTPVPFNPPQKFVTDGLYNYVRNPMHLGWTFMLIGLGLAFASFTLLVIFTPGFFIIHFLYLRFIEEKELERKFGQSYLDYKKRVPMFFPKIKRT
ncbi:MAG TPA: isoprenylcysteine carboxylmethyltransferase family protein [Dehalococcoidales bacterium]|nr:isoprenylcysteine carboxylmethyltransferase family protein [Dehalococcoidales bacterium]